MIPAIAVARELRARGHDVFFVGTERGMEGRLVPAEGFELRKIEIGGLNRVGMRRRNWPRWCDCRCHDWQCAGVRAGDAAAVFSMGGYVAGPPVIAALLRRIPVVVMEPNAIPGFTNRRIARFVARALINFPETARFFPPGQTEVTGLPVRDEFFRIRPRTARRRPEPAGHRRQPGIAHAEPSDATELADIPRLGHSRCASCTRPGRRSLNPCATSSPQSVWRARSSPFIRDMPAAFARPTWWFAARAPGRSRNWRPRASLSILVPFPFAADDHQTRNAEAMRNAAAPRAWCADADINWRKAGAADQGDRSDSLEEWARPHGSWRARAQRGARRIF